MSAQSRRWLGAVVLLLGSGLMAVLVLNQPKQKAMEQPGENYAQLVPETDSEQMALPEESFQPLATDVLREQELLAAENAKRAAEAAQREAEVEQLILNEVSPVQSTPAGVTPASEPKPVPAPTAAEQAQKAAEAAAKALAEKTVDNVAEKQVATAKKSWMVQVALTVDEAAAKKVAAKLKAKGIKATLSKTSKGVRVLAGDEASKADAEKIRKQVTDIEPSAWVIHWEPVN